MKRHTAVSLAATFTLLCCSILPVGAYDMGSPEEPLRLSAGLSHTVYVDETGTLWAWGSNQASQLGTETQETSTDLEGNPIPYASQPLAVMEDVVSASAGADFTVALKTDGTLWTWGGNDEGQLGTGTTEGSATPRPGAGPGHRRGGRGLPRGRPPHRRHPLDLGGQPLRPAGRRHLHQPPHPGPGDGGGHHRGRRGGGPPPPSAPTTPCGPGGDNLFGQLGDGTQDSPTPPADPHRRHPLDVGSNIDGQLGTGRTTEVLQTQPVQVPLNGAVLAVAAGTGHTVAILEDGTLWVWGRNDQGQLGLDPDTAALVPQPTQVTEATGAVDVAAGTYQTACLLSDGTLLTWGAQRLLGSGSVEAWAETATEDTTAQVTPVPGGRLGALGRAGRVRGLSAGRRPGHPPPPGLSFASFQSFGFLFYFCIKRGVYLLAQSCKSMGGLCHGTLSPCRSAPGRPRQPGLDPGTTAMPRSAPFPFPPLYLGDDLAQLAKEDPDLPPSSTSACSSLSTMSTATCPPWTWWKTSSTRTSTRNPPGCGATTPAPVGRDSPGDLL